MKSSKILVGILAGVTAGAIVGILFAPEKGSRTRRGILDKSEDYADELKDKIVEFINSVSKKYQTAMHGVEKIAVKGKENYDEAMQKVNSLGSKVK